MGNKTIKGSHQPKDTSQAKQDAPKLGVLFVHGLGNSKRGEHLPWAGEQLYQWLCKWINPDHSCDDSHIDDSKVYMTDSRLSRAIPSEQDAPAFVEVNFRNLDGTHKPTKTAPVQQHWVFAECIWNAEFPQATYNDLVNWGLGVAPWLINRSGKGFTTQILNVIKEMQDVVNPRRVSTDDDEVVSTGIGGWGIVVRLTLMLTHFILMRLLGALLLVLGLFVQLGLLALMILAPLPLFSNFVQSIQQNLAGNLGDGYIIASSPMRLNAMLSQVRRDINWLRKQGCTKVAVIAHSGGASVSYEALFQPNDPSQPNSSEVDLLVTYGSGLSKLNAIRDHQSDRSPFFIARTVIQVVLFVLVLWSLLFSGNQLGYAAAFLVAVLVPASVFICLSVLTKLLVLIKIKRLKDKLLKGKLVDLLQKRLFNPIKHRLLATGRFIRGTFQTVALPFALWSLLSSGNHLGWDVQFWYAVAFGVILLFWRLNYESAGGIEKTAFKQPRAKKWRDYYAVADIVPDGKTNFVESKSLSVEVHNLDSLIKDHGSYWYNNEQFVADVARELCEQAGLENIVFADPDNKKQKAPAPNYEARYKKEKTIETYSVISEANARRYVRVFTYFMAGLLSLLCLSPILFGLGNWVYGLGKAVVGALSFLPSFLTGFKPEEAASISGWKWNIAIGVLTCAALVALWHQFFIFPFWRYWSRKESNAMHYQYKPENTQAPAGSRKPDDPKVVEKKKKKVVEGLLVFSKRFLVLFMLVPALASVATFLTLVFTLWQEPTWIASGRLHPIWAWVSSAATPAVDLREVIQIFCDKFLLVFGQSALAADWVARLELVVKVAFFALASLSLLVGFFICVSTVSLLSMRADADGLVKLVEKARETKEGENSPRDSTVPEETTSQSGSQPALNMAE